MILHKEYINAGANIITTNTFGANELKLKKYGYTVEEIIDSAVNIAKEAVADRNVKIALDIGPIGQILEPMGDIKFLIEHMRYLKGKYFKVWNLVQILFNERPWQIYMKHKAAV